LKTPVPVVQDNLIVKSGKVAKPLFDFDEFQGVPVPLELEVVDCICFTLFVCNQLVALYFDAREVQTIVPHIKYTVHPQLHFPSHPQPVRKCYPVFRAVSAVLNKLLVVGVLSFVQHVFLYLRLSNHLAVQRLDFVMSFGLLDNNTVLAGKLNSLVVVVYIKEPSIAGCNARL